ncbi:hypothetical protein GCM10020331_077500 [Ectobacillus funiculus]
MNETPERVQAIVKQCGLDYAQLHGEEDEAYCKDIQVPAIKAFGVASPEAIQQATKYEVDYVLFDSPKEEYHGGNGKKPLIGTFYKTCLRNFGQSLFWQAA